MKVVVQRVKESSVTIDGSVYGQIQKGFMVLVGFCQDDTKEIVDKIVDKMISLRVFEDENDLSNECFEKARNIALDNNDIDEELDCFIKLTDSQNDEYLNYLYLGICYAKLESYKNAVDKIGLIFNNHILYFCKKTTN